MEWTQPSRKDFRHQPWWVYISIDVAVPFASALTDNEIIASVLPTPEPEPKEVEQEEVYSKVTY